MKVRRLLVANRGEIARRVMRTARRMGISTVAVYSEPDAQALHVREADRAHALGGRTSTESYLSIEKIIAAARATAADAVHPGYGFLSENAEFAQAVEDAGLTWIGPPAAAIRALGNKSRARQLAHDRGVRCLPGYAGEDQSEQRLLEEGERIGLPLMVKASAGGGGRGMRLVTEAAQLAAALRSARSEAASAFGSGELLLERALLDARHVEIQVFCDTHGNGVHLGERDCSVQRRHQKIIEEAPSPAVDPELRDRMGQCAVDLAQSAGYTGAGTVEFLLQGADFFLMEMNTRLQVEHPVTEAVTGFDLVEWQIRIARGEPLPRRQKEIRFSGHAIEVRLCAEDENFTPHCGRVLKFLPPPLGEGRGGGAPRALRFDHAIFDQQDVPPYYDSMLGKLISHAPTREEAIAQLTEALDDLRLLGLPSNRRFLAACLRHPVFAAGEARVPFLAAHAPAIRRQLEEQEWRVAAEAAFCAVLPDGGAPALPSPFTRPVRIRHRELVFDLPLCEADGIDGGQAQVVSLAPGQWHVQSGAVDLFLCDASYEPPAAAAGGAGANELRAPFNGKVIGVQAAAGTSVRKGDTLLVIESMKLEHALAAPRDAVVQSVQVEAGQQVATARVLLTFEAA